MATFTYHDIGLKLDMSLPVIPGLFQFSHYSGNRTSLKLFDGSDSALFTGTGFTYTTGQNNRLLDINSGTLNEITSVVNGNTWLIARGLNVSAQKLADAAFAGQEAKFLSLLLAGNDTIKGTRYADKIIGLAGNDTLFGGAGGDRLDGGAGLDTASYSNASKGIVASLGSNAANTNDAKGDVYVSIENLTGTRYADKLTGTGGANTLTGGGGDDRLSGGAGSDKIYGGQGADDLYGGSGLDVFQFKTLADSFNSAPARDTIFDFSVSDGDLIDLSVIDANGKTPGDEAFKFVGTKAFSGASGELRYVKQASDTYIYADVNGDKTADFAIHLDDAITLSKGYFVL